MFIVLYKAVTGRTSATIVILLCVLLHTPDISITQDLHETLCQCVTFQGQNLRATDYALCAHIKLHDRCRGLHNGCLRAINYLGVWLVLMANDTVGQPLCNPL